MITAAPGSLEALLIEAVRLGARAQIVPQRDIAAGVTHFTIEIVDPLSGDLIRSCDFQSSSNSVFRWPSGPMPMEHDRAPLSHSSLFAPADPVWAQPGRAVGGGNDTRLCGGGVGGAHYQPRRFVG